ncbi:D-hexose-6-phosphate mutarotase [Pantoea sp. 1.19]|uniref:D-hexose-6-phosphate mutarotase n=1 Tax=Pantoea sp. 1.19 TaxID=1925589 RepID=UPI0009490D28|nr:D-hexose-6-phosphate mutarotase [Pantoea sp. 1.19]
MHDDLFSLPVDEQLTPYITRRRAGELPILVIAHPRVRAAVALQGAHLLAWQPGGARPVIWVSDKTQLISGKAIRGGVPICWPWFGPAGEPAHGFARTQPWALSAHDENDDCVVLTLSLSQNEQTLKIWPHPFTLFARFRFSADRCELELEAHGDFLSSGALHSYFAVEDIAGVTVSGLGQPYLDKVLDGAPGTSPDGTQRYTQRVDRIYTAPDACSVIRDEAGKRTLEIYHHYHSDVVTWNPGAALSCSMADMRNDGYRQFVCVETARIHQPLKSAAECPARLAVTLRIRPDAG